MRLLLTFDKFKHSMSAREACEAARKGALEACPDWETREAPLTDGGEGFVEILVEAAAGRLFESEVTGPAGEKVSALYGMVPLENVPEGARNLLELPADGEVAAIEMAQASGLFRLEKSARDPRRTVTTGVGELIAEAARRRPRGILLGLGGSATHDLGLGALTALGLRFANASLPPAPVHWPELGRIAGFEPPDLPPIRIACDVTNPLLGERGAAAVFSRQKGLPEDAIAGLDEDTRRMAGEVLAFFGKEKKLLDRPGSGAAGGVAFGLMAALDAAIVPGFALTSEWLRLEEKMKWAGEIWTGEGSFDDSSLEGKGPGHVVAAARKLEKKFAVLAGVIELSPEKRRGFADGTLFSLTNGGKADEAALKEGAERLRNLAASLASGHEHGKNRDE